jgi:hypothetical protein
MKKILEIIKMNIMENEQGNLSLDKKSWIKNIGTRNTSPILPVGI